MEIQKTAMQSLPNLLPVQNPASAQSDDRSAVGKTKDPTLVLPSSTPANTTQSGLISKAAIAEKEAIPTPDTFGVSAAERTLKPYGVNMLPEKNDAPEQQTPA